MWALDVLGVIALDGTGEPCFFPVGHTDPDGVPVKNNPDLAAAILAAPRRVVASERVLAALDGFDAEPVQR